MRKLEPAPVEATGAQPFGSGSTLLLVAGAVGKVIVVGILAWFATTFGSVGASPFRRANINARLARRRASIA
jgi:hypothetical protein